MKLRDDVTRPACRSMAQQIVPFVAVFASGLVPSGKKPTSVMLPATAAVAVAVAAAAAVAVAAEGQWQW